MIKPLRKVRAVCASRHMQTISTDECEEAGPVAPRGVDGISSQGKPASLSRILKTQACAVVKMAPSVSRIDDRHACVHEVVHIARGQLHAASPGNSRDQGIGHGNRAP